MHSEGRRRVPSPSSHGVDFRAVLYGNTQDDPSMYQGSSSLGPPPVAGTELAGAPQRAFLSGGGAQQVLWSNTHYGDWLTESSPSSRRSFFPEDVQRVGEVQRVRGAASYRGPSGISQSQIGVSPCTPFALDQGKPYLGAGTGEAYIGSPPQVSSSDIYGRPSSRSSRGRHVFFDGSADIETSGEDVYVLAPGGDPCAVEDHEEGGGRILEGLLGRRIPSPRRGGPWAAGAGSLRGPQGEGPPADLGGPLEPPPFERFSPLDISKGPLRIRYSTDVCCLFLFGGCWVILAWLVLSSLSNSSPLRLTAGIDWKGRVCGLDEGVENLPYLYWPSKVPPQVTTDTELDSCSLLPVCTSACPTGFAPSRPHGLCDSESENRGLCSWYSSRPSRLMLRRFCVFVDANGFPRDHGILNSWFHWVGDLALVWPLAFLVPLASFALAYGFFWILRKAATSVIGIFVMSIELLLGVCSYYFFTLSHASSFTAEAAAAYEAPYEFLFVPGWAALGLGVTFAVCTVGFLLLVMAWWKQLSLCTTVLKSAAMVLHEAPPKFLALLPVFTATAFAVHSAFALLGVLHLMASGSVTRVSPPGVCDYADPWQRLSLGVLGRLSVAFVILMALWTSAFISGVCQLVVSYFTACCYFTPHDADRREILDAKATEAVRVVLRNHLGSAAFGGLLLSLVEVARLCLFWVRRVNIQRNENVFRLVLRTVANALAAVYAALSVFTQTAFVYVAILGQPLLRAAWTAAATQKRNLVAVAFVWQFGRILQMAGQLMVAGLVTWGTFIILPRIPGTYGPEGQLSSLTAPLLFAFLVSYNVASSCMKCFGFASLTILQCYLADIEMSRQEGKATPAFAPRPLRLAQKHLIKKNVQGV